ncbi:MAG TPA: apolipoprotein N-acyltransferase, partial [Sphingomicrobium sp.]
VIDAHGQVVSALPWRRAGVIDATLPAPAAPTLFGRYGNIIPLLLGFGLLLSGIVLARTRR